MSSSQKRSTTSIKPWFVHIGLPHLLVTIQLYRSLCPKSCLLLILEVHLTKDYGLQSTFQDHKVPTYITFEALRGTYIKSIGTPLTHQTRNLCVHSGWIIKQLFSKLKISPQK